MLIELDRSACPADNGFIARVDRYKEQADQAPGHGCAEESPQLGWGHGPQSRAVRPGAEKFGPTGELAMSPRRSDRCGQPQFPESGDDLGWAAAVRVALAGRRGGYHSGRVGHSEGGGQ